MSMPAQYLTEVASTRTIAAVAPVEPTSPPIDAIKTKMKAAWMDGDYARFARYMEPGAIEVLNEWNIVPGERMLDVACGAGQIVIPAARTGVAATGVDIASNQIAAARARAEFEGLPARFDEGDAEQLPYDNGSFDVVTTMFGAMFAPRPERVATELARVCRPGGRLFMANWTPAGMVGQMFKAIARHVPPPAGIAPPPLWGDEDTVSERLDDGFTDITLTPKYYTQWAYPFGVDETVEWFRQHYGPIVRAFAALDDNSQQSLRADLERVFAYHNCAIDGTTLLAGEYLEVAAVRR